MFHSIRPSILERMRFLEQIDARDRLDGTPRLQRLRQIPPRRADSCPAGSRRPQGDYLEIGTSAGYSTLWIAIACEMLGRSLTTFEVLPKKRNWPRHLPAAGLAGLVKLVQGDARQFLPQLSQYRFCFLDAEKEVYADCYEAVVPNLVPALAVADNAINHEQSCSRCWCDPQSTVDALIVPIGQWRVALS